MPDLKNRSFYSFIQLFDSRSDFCFGLAISYFFKGGGVREYSLNFIDKVWKHDGNKYLKQ